MGDGAIPCPHGALSLQHGRVDPPQLLAAGAPGGLMQGSSGGGQVVGRRERSGKIQLRLPAQFLRATLRVLQILVPSVP